jgi:signal transduction histidine kinase
VPRAPRRTRPLPARRASDPLDRTRLAAVLQVVRAVGSTLDLRELLPLVMDQVTEVMKADRSTLFLIDDATGELWSTVAQRTRLKEIRLPAGHGIAGWVARHGRALNVPDAYGDARFDPATDRATGWRTGSLFAVPVLDASARVLGVMQALHHDLGHFRRADERLLTALAAQVGLAVERARMYQAAVGRNRELSRSQERLRAALADLDVLYGFERQISQAEGLDSVIDAMVSRAMELCGAEAGSVLLVAEDTGQLYFKSALGEKGEDVKKFSLRRGQGIAGRVAATGQPIVANDVEESEAWDPRIARKVRFPTRSAICVPIQAEGVVIGALELINKPGGFDDGDLRRLTLMAGQAGRVIQVGRGREERERSLRMEAIGRMLASLLHDLRTPVTVVSGYAELMAGEEDAGKRHAYAATIRRQLAHVEAMTRETLQFARGERELLVTSVHLPVFAAELREYLEPQLSGHGVVLVVEPEPTGIARFDAHRIHRLVHNLASNAVDAMPEGGTFTVRVEQGPRELVMGFTDTGRGIPRPVMDRLFEAFVTRGKAQGTGLGLAMVKKVVDDHGGTVHFESRPGRGTTCTVRLPQ